MKRISTVGKKLNKSSGQLISELLELQKVMEKLPELSEIEKANLNQEISVSHLYYSSKIEGTKLTHKQIEKAVHDSETIQPR